ncbi:transposase [Streptomyces sp. NPDC058463]|uniref:transposase n=1 Tax=Streptomyces sp. NPDC058463 TaxID=3346510 RepID=UPI00365640CA
MARGDLTDEQWSVLEPLLPRGTKAGRPPVWPRRQLVDGIRFRVRGQSLALSRDGRFVLTGTGEGTIRRWELDWELGAREPADWDQGAAPYLGRAAPAPPARRIRLAAPRRHSEPTRPHDMSHGAHRPVVARASRADVIYPALKEQPVRLDGSHRPPRGSSWACPIVGDRR